MIKYSWVDWYPLSDERTESQKLESLLLTGSAEFDRLRGAALFAHSADAIVDLDPAGVITGFNPAAEGLFG